MGEVTVVLVCVQMNQQLGDRPAKNNQRSSGQPTLPVRALCAWGYESGFIHATILT
jgi:hypothetical protein